MGPSTPKTRKAPASRFYLFANWHLMTLKVCASNKTFPRGRVTPALVLSREDVLVCEFEWSEIYCCSGPVGRIWRRELTLGSRTSVQLQIAVQSEGSDRQPRFGPDGDRGPGGAWRLDLLLRRAENVLSAVPGAFP